MDQKSLLDIKLPSSSSIILLNVLTDFLIILANNFH
jgi:hypothetical protein